MSIPKASLKFSVYAWAKLQFFLKEVNTEVGMMGVSSKEDPLTIIDLAVIPQQCTAASVEFSEDGIANFYEDCTDLGMSPTQYSRIWIHTHPTGVHSPSGTDEKTFQDIFGNCDWAVMYILSKDGKDYCALQYNKFPQHRVELVGTRVDFSIPFQGSNEDLWKEELKENVKKKEIVVKKEQKQQDKFGHFGSKINPFDKWTGRPYKASSYYQEQLDDFYEGGFFEDDFSEDFFIETLDTKKI